MFAIDLVKKKCEIIRYKHQKTYITDIIGDTKIQKDFRIVLQTDY